MFNVYGTPVPSNSKCGSCLHYNGSQARTGVCEVGTQPQICGNGTEPLYGYAPLDSVGPDEIDDIATPMISGASGVMNETGGMEPTVQMKRVVLGDEDLTIAQRILGQVATLSKAISSEDVSHRGYYVAKSLRDQHFAPRKQKKFTLKSVMDFLHSNGIEMTDRDYAYAGLFKAEMPKSLKPNVRRV